MNWLDQETIRNLITILGILIAGLMVIWQMARQHRDSLALQRNNFREELKLRLHEVLVEKVRKLTDANVSTAMYAFQIPINLQIRDDHRKLGLERRPMDQRADEFARLHEKASIATIALLEEFEAWAIAFPGLDVFMAAFNSASHDAREAFPPLHTVLLEILPFDTPQDAPPNIPRPLVQSPPSNEKIDQLKTLVNKYKEAMDDILCYASDLVRESQNNLLSGLFEHRVPPRVPLDKRRHKVISTDPERMKELIHYFHNETAWGKDQREINTRVLETLRGGNQPGR